MVNASKHFTLAKLKLMYSFAGSKRNYVMKAFKPQFFNEKWDMDVFVKIHLKACELADQFNKDMQLNHPVIFKQPMLHTISTTLEKDGKPLFVKVSVVHLL